MSEPLKELSYDLSRELCQAYLTLTHGAEGSRYAGFVQEVNEHNEYELCVVLNPTETEIKHTIVIAESFYPFTALLPAINAVFPTKPIQDAHP